MRDQESVTGRTNRLAAWALLALSCVGSRLATGIYYVEDPDSLRFALAVVDGFSVAELQPHFPGYPVYWAVCRIGYLVTGSLGATFALVGGVATFALCTALLRMLNWRLTSTRGLVLVGLVGVNPLLWLMGTRYMPDLSGLALAVVAFGLMTGRLGPSGSARRWGWFVAGVLAGWRLSYVPVLLVPMGWEAFRGRVDFRHVLWGTLGVVVWLVPMVVDTGWGALWSAAWAQTEGHFTEFGGTVGTRPDLGERAVPFLRSIWADGLGGWWPGRHLATVPVSIGWIAVGAVGTRRSWSKWRRSGPETAAYRRGLAVACAAVLLYGAWAFFFQNVIHKPRHVLPVLVPLFPIAALGAAELARTRSGAARTVLRIGLILAGLAYALVTGVLARQHGSPSAPAQVRQHVAEITTSEDGDLRVLSIPLLNYYLAGQGVEAEYLSLRDSTERLRASDMLDRGTTVVVGRNAPPRWPEPARADTFYHNPYVNRMWPRIAVYLYQPPGDE